VTDGILFKFSLYLSKRGVLTKRYSLFYFISAVRNGIALRFTAPPILVLSERDHCFNCNCFIAVLKPSVPQADRN